MNNKRRTIKAFTLVEVVVAVGLLAVMLIFATMIFKVTIGTRRVAAANEEIMQKLRAITDQLNSDFKELDKTAPLLIQFQQDPAGTGNRFDQIMFFSTGDFTSSQLYGGHPALFKNVPGGPIAPIKTIKGNAARIYYGHANIWDSLLSSVLSFYNNPNNRIFARRQHILTANTKLQPWPALTFSDFAAKTFDPPLNLLPLPFWPWLNNEYFEHDSMSLAQWKVAKPTRYDLSAGGTIIPVCFYNRAQINLTVPNTLHNLMCRGVGNFAVQWAYWDGNDKMYYWFPDDSPYGTNTYSHYAWMTSNGALPYCGVRFNIPGDNAVVTETGGTKWYPIKSGSVQYNNTGTQSLDYFPTNFYPAALKFTFTLYDSKDVITNGRVFTHIVYIGG